MSAREALAHQRLASARLLGEADRTIETAVLSAMSEWLDATRVAILREARNILPGLSAAGYANPSPALEAATDGYSAWQRKLSDTVLPSIGYAFGESYNQVRKGAEFSPYRWQTEYIDKVSDRLKIWPEGAMDELRPELGEALAEAESYDQMTARVGMVLGIDAPTRAFRARISFVDDQIRNETDPDRLAELRRRRANLWERHDDSLGEWEWKARRIARTEAHGAVVGGKVQAAAVRAEYTREALYKGWISTQDERVRVTHRVADGQIVRMAESFRVGGHLIPYPAAPIETAPQETIQCRCDVLIMDYDQVQEMLSGPDGSMGEIRPGGQRIGPDDVDDADAAIDKWAEIMQRPRPATPSRENAPVPAPVADGADPLEVEVDHTPESPHPDLNAFTDDELIQWMQDANASGDKDLFEAVAGEMDRRLEDSPPDAMVDPDPDDDGAELLDEDDPDTGDQDPVDDEDTEQLEDDVDPGDEPEVADEPAVVWAPPGSTPTSSPDDWDPWSGDPEPEPEVALTRFQRAELAFNDAMASGESDDRVVDRLIAEMEAAENEERELEAQSDEFNRLIDEEGYDPDEAEAKVTGKTPERVRKDRAIAELRHKYANASGFDQLIAKEWRARLEILYFEAEAATNGYMVKAQYQNKIDPAELWTQTEAFARKYASDEMLEWFDQNGRLTRQDVVDEYLGGGKATGGTNRQGQDFLR